MVEKIMEDISFNASENADTTFEVTKDYVGEKVKDYMHATDLKRYII